MVGEACEGPLGLGQELLPLIKARASWQAGQQIALPADSRGHPLPRGPPPDASCGGRPLPSCTQCWGPLHLMPQTPFPDGGP